MQIESYIKKIDISITLLITYFFIFCISFYYLKFDNDFENYIILAAIMIIALISYYTNITFSLVISLVFSFSYCSYKLYGSITKGNPIDTKVYYWVISIVITGVLVATLSQYILKIQNEIKRLSNENKCLIMVDSLTGIRNSTALFNELPIYMSMSKRYKIPITLMLVKFKYNNKVKSIVGEDSFKEIIVNCSETLKNSLRFEDRKYILSDENTFAFILVSEKDGCEIIKSRFKESVKKVNMDKQGIFNKIKLEIQVGYCLYNDEIEDAFDFFNKAEMEIDYDV